MTRRSNARTAPHPGPPSAPLPAGAVLVAYAALTLLTLAVFWPARGFDFVTYDDPTYVYDNAPVVAGPTAESVVWAFTTRHSANWHPLTWLSLMLDVALHGVEPRGFHATAIWLHLANSLLLFEFLRRTTGAVGPALFAAALFAVHPLHVEPVVWVSSRKDVLSTLFGLIALVAHAGNVRRPSRVRYAVSLAAFALSLLAKQMLVTLPFLLVLLDLWPLRRFEWDGWRRSARAALRLVPEKLPFFALAIAAGAVAYAAQRGGGAMRDFEEFPLAGRLANGAVAYVLYLTKTLWPTGLCAYYPYPAAIPAWQVAGALALLGGITAVALAQVRRRPSLAVGWLWYVGTLLPVIGIVQLGGQRMADRYTYVPLVGPFVALAWLLTAPPRARAWRKRALGAAALAVILALATAARAQSLHWRDSLSLFRRAVAVTSGNAVAHNNLGAEYGRAGQLDAALEQFRAALAADPGFADAHNNLGNALLQRGRTGEATDHFHEALRLDPDLVAARMNLGLVLEREGRTAEALAQYDRAAALGPGNAAVLRHVAAAHERYGEALLERGERERAVQQFREALRLDPGLGSARDHLRRAGDPDPR